MRIGNSNNTDLWKNFMNAKTPQEKKKILQEDIKSKSINQEYIKKNINYDIDIINKYDKLINQIDDEDEECLVEDSRLNSKSSELKKILKKLKAQALAERIARGEHLSKKEISYLKKNSPELIAKAKAANIQRKNIEVKIKTARTSKEAEDLLFLARGMNVSISRSSGSEDGQKISSLLNEAYNKAERNTRMEIVKKKEKENRNKKHIDKCI